MTTTSHDSGPTVVPAKSTPLATIRAFAVMAGGAFALFVLAVGSVLVVVVALARGDTPPWPALAGAVAALAYVAVVLPWSRRWGTTPTERREVLPGDEAVPDAGIQMTRAITIDAPTDAVWPWIAQIGQDRGGFYSYTWLENLAGCRMHNAARVHPEWQHRDVGETVLLHPQAGIPVSRFEPNRSYALQGWYFALVPVAPHRTRLLARSRIPSGLPSVAYALFVELPHFIMERKMLLTIKQRVERGRT